MNKMLALLNAVEFRNRYPLGRKVTVGEVARTLEKPKSTVHRHMVKACGEGLIETESFVRGRTVCYAFKVSADGYVFMNSFGEVE